MEKKMSPPVANNPSFLHDNFVSENKYMTIDRLALKRSSLPLRLMPKSVDHYDNAPNISGSSRDIIAGSYSLFSLQQSNYTTKESLCQDETLEEDVLPSNYVKTSQENIKINGDKDLKKKETNNYFEASSNKKWGIYNPCEKHKQIPEKYNSKFQNTIGNSRFITRSKWIFRSLAKRGKCQEKSFSKSDFIKNHQNQKDLSEDLCRNNPKIHHHRSVSLPSDLFQTNNDDDDEDDNRHYDETNFWSNDKHVPLKEMEKCISVPSIKYNKNNKTLSSESGINKMNLLKVNDEVILKNGGSTLKLYPNSSFLWCNKTEYSDKNEIYGNIKSTEKQIAKSIDDNDDGDENYDDVGFLSLKKDDIYDDVGVPLEDPSTNHDEQVYDDVIFSNADNDKAKDELIYKEIVNDTNVDVKLDIEQSSRRINVVVDDKIDNCVDKLITKKTESIDKRNIYTKCKYSSVAEDADDEDNVYDDVDYLGESRINSIYVESKTLSQIDPSAESDWEDLEDMLSSTKDKTPKRLIRNTSEAQSISFNVKKPGHKWKVRRQRSKASRKSSKRSTNRASRKSTLFVAVSLGTGSVLLIGSLEEEEQVNPKTCSNSSYDFGQKHFQDFHQESLLINQITFGLVQLRIILNDSKTVDTQETSCYIIEADSDSGDSNYETLNSFEPVDNLNGVTEDLENLLKKTQVETNENIMEKEKLNKILLEVPLKPIPPPPRECSLTETFGRKMKILKRTWSITKGSLGRIRKKTMQHYQSTDVDFNPDFNIDDINDPNNKLSNNFNNNSNIYERKSSQVFNFKKHFQRSTTSSSIFYVDDKDKDDESDKNINDIYENINQYIPLSSLENNSDDYNLLAEEPLYQFYAAATVKGAFRSDSDSYAETDDSNSLGYSSLELIKPGQRTLWCQTPQVINSGLLDQMSNDEKKLQESKFEILTSEASYLNSLRVLVNEFLINHELVYEALAANDREILFGNVPKVLMASEKFLSHLETKWKSDILLNGLADIILKHAEMSADVYIKYCSNQVSMDLKLKELKSKKYSKFMETVTRIESYPACHNLSLHSFLILPMQRITRLPLLADAVLSKLNTEHPERLQWEKLLSVISRIVKECNEGARKAGRQIEIDALSKKLEYPVKIPPVDLKDRYLIRSGPVTHLVFKTGSDYSLTFRKKYQKIVLYLLLITDHLLIAKLKTNGGNEFYSMVDSCKRNLIALEKVSDESPFANQHTMILTLLENYAGRNVEYILMCKNDTERERWLDAVSPPKSNSVGETLYETWDCPQVMALFSYVPIQPDELSLQPGDVINVLRKMADGWNLGEKLVSGEQGWFPGNYTKEVLSEHVRAKNLRQRHRLMALTENFLQHHATQMNTPR